MAIELSRMDFHVTRFMNSEDVEAMTAEEIGQYMLLLCKAWALARECSLPDDRDTLRLYVRSKCVSRRVLMKFPKVRTEWGVRRRNDVQYAIWLEAKDRSECGRNAAAMRWKNKGNAISDHTIPEQTEQSRTDQSPLTLEQFADKVL